VFVLDYYNIKMDAITETLKGIQSLKLEDGNAEKHGRFCFVISTTH
jgi:hypothetical protein